MSSLNLEHLCYHALCALSDGVIITNVKGQVKFLNKVAERLSGKKIEYSAGKQLEEVFATYLDDGQTQYIPSLVEGLSQMNLPDYLIVRNYAGNVRYYITGTISYFSDKESDFSGFVLLFHDVSYQRQKELQIQYKAFHDTLTGLYNRAFFEVEVERLSSERLLPLSVIMADANGLKLVNDVFGHYEGDELLKKTANVLRNACRKEDIIARTGGDEFVILLPKVDKEGTQAIIDRIRTACHESIASPIPLSISLGMATRENTAVSIISVIKLAEEQMYTNKLKENYKVRGEVINFITKSLEGHAGETEEHGKRIKKISVNLAKRIGIGEYEQIQLELLAMMHDIGKIAIPKHILSKPGGLETEEWRIMRKHSEIGYRIAAYFPEMALLGDAILSLHERWDGKGYPRGLKGDDIPINSRILAIAETYDVLTNGSCYRSPVSSVEALREIQRCSGSQFDPELVKHFVEMMNNDTNVQAQ